MSKSVPHYSEEWLEAYRKRLSSLEAVPIHGLVGEIGVRDGKKFGKGPRFRAQKPATARLATDTTLVPYSPVESVAVPFRAAGGKQTKTEEKYNRECLAGRGRFEAVTLHLPGGGRYTPDFMTVDDGVVTFHEVKGSYRLGSQGRAYTAFHEAAAYYPMWRFVWAHWTGKAWERKTLPEIRI